MSDKVIFDTNTARSESSIDEFLGNRAELSRFSQVAELIFPDMVIEEIKNQKRKNLMKGKDGFIKNAFHRLLGLSEETTSSFDIEAYIHKLQDDEPIVYSQITLTNNNVLSQMKELAIWNKAPFEENSDKGFKDAYIYFTVLEYLGAIDDACVYFVTKDDRLKETFQNNERVRVVENFDGFQKYRISYFQENYFLEEFETRIEGKITADDIKDVWTNINGNRVVKITSEGPTFLVEVDFSTKEIIDHTMEDFVTDKEDLADAVTHLISSGSFDATDFYVDCLQPYVPYFTDQQIIDLIEASATNNQIYRVAEKDALKAFFKPLFEYKKNVLSEDIRTNFIHYFK